MLLSESAHLAEHVASASAAGKNNDAKTVSENVFVYVYTYVCMYVVHNYSLVSVSMSSSNANTLPDRNRKLMDSSP